MDSRDYMKAFGEWLCSIAPNPMAKSMLHGSMKDMYERDYILVTNLCNEFGYIPEIPESTIDGAKERSIYFELNGKRFEITKNIAE